MTVCFLKKKKETTLEFDKAAPFYRVSLKNKNMQKNKRKRNELQEMKRRTLLHRGIVIFPRGVEVGKGVSHSERNEGERRG